MAEPAKKAQPAEPPKPAAKAAPAKPVRVLLPASESSDGAVQQLIALRSIAQELGQADRVNELNEQLAGLGYK